MRHVAIKVNRMCWINGYLTVIFSSGVFLALYYLRWQMYE